MSTIETFDQNNSGSVVRTKLNSNFAALNADKAETTDVATKAPIASPTFTGTVTLPVGLTGIIRTDSGVVSVDTSSVVNASDTVKGIVEEATAAEITAGTATGATGARLYVNPSLIANAAISATAGVGDAGKIVKTDSAGQIDRTLVRSTYAVSKFNDTSASNSTSPVTLATVSIPVGALGLNGGLRITASWTINNNNASNRTGTFSATLGGTTIGTFTSGLVNQSTGSIRNEWTMLNINSNTSKMTMGTNMQAVPSGTTLVVSHYTLTGLSIDTSSAQTLLIRGNTSDATNATFTLQAVMVEIIST